MRVEKGVSSRTNERTRTALDLFPSGKYGVWRVMYIYNDTWTEGQCDRPIVVNMDTAFIDKMNVRCVSELPSANYLKQLEIIRSSRPLEAERV